MAIYHPRYVTEQEVVELHDQALRAVGGLPGIRDPGALESCVAQPKMAVFGVERYPTAHEKAAAYSYYIDRNQPFMDGNKRTAFLSAIHFLRTNWFDPQVDEEEAYDVLTRVATGEAGLEELSSLFHRAIRFPANGNS